MFSYFRQSTPLKWLGLVAVLIMARLPILLLGYPVSLAHIASQKVAEQIANGALLYRDIWTDLPPLSAYLMGYLEWLAPGSQLLNGFVALLLVGYQAFVFTRMSLSLDVFTERNYTPGLVYLILLAVVPDYLTLSPALIALTFLLPTFSRLARHLRVGVPEEEMFSTGLLLGFAALCHLPSAMLVAWLMLVYGLYSGATFRHYVLLILGVLLPNVVAYLIWFWAGAGTDYYYNYILSAIGGSTHLYLVGYQIVMLLLAPILFWLLAILRIYSQSRFINYQSVMQTVMILWLMVGLVAIVFSFDGTPDDCLLILPPIAYMLVHYFQSFHKFWIAEAIFLLFAGAMVGCLVIASQAPQSFDPTIPVGDLYVHPGLNQHHKGVTPALVSHKKIWVIGNDYRFYANAKLAGPYLDYDLSLRHLNATNRFDVVSVLYRNLATNLPDLIIDQKKQVPILFSRLPILAKDYRQIKGTDVYEKVYVTDL